MVLVLARLGLVLLESDFMATFSVKPTEGQDPWGATDLAWRSSVEAAVNASEVTIDKSAGIKVSVQDNAAGRKQLIYGDTGWRDITTLLGNGWSADKFYINRRGYELQVAVQNLKSTGGSTQITTAILPGGFYPLSALGSSSTLRVAGTPLIVHSNGHIYAKATTATTTTDLEFSTTIPVYSSWPSVLPGTAVGSIPNA